MILSIDIGSSSVRTALFDSTARLVSKTFVRHEWRSEKTNQSAAEIDADKALDQVGRAIDEMLLRAEDVKGEITHAAVSCFWHSLVGVDEKGKPTTKVLGWADTRGRDAAVALRRKFDESEVHNRIGARSHSSFWPAKLLWLKKAFPAVWGKTARWLSLSDYVSLRFFGEASTSISMASATGLFDIRKCEWDRDLLKFLKLKPESLPPIAADDATFRLNSKFAKRWPRLKETRWFPAIGDGAANNIGAGCTKKGRAALMIGTSGAMRVAYKGEPPEKIPPGLWCYRIDRERVIVGGALSDGGGLYELLKRTLLIEGSDAEIGREMARRGADAHGLTVMPFFFGERSTGYHENASGAILGLNASHDAIDILQAAMEAVAFRFAEIFDQLKMVAPIREIAASGGALDSSPVWRQIIADVLGRDLLVSGTREASMHGAVLLALESLGKIDSIERFSNSYSKLKFHPNCHATYKIARERHVFEYNQLIKDRK
ncbi:MAG: gluconokinase [Chloracidobacterium sp.]|nr:gluconokinase [Chloracidobacterium sp.]